MAQVEQKVKDNSIMAGTFAPIDGETHLEYNIVHYIPSAQYLAENWPTPIYWSGFEVGLEIRYPDISIENDFNYLDRHPIPCLLLTSDAADDLLCVDPSVRRIIKKKNKT